VRDVGPDVLVVRLPDGAGFTVLRADDLLRQEPVDPGEGTVGEYGRGHGTPALVVETDDGWLRSDAAVDDGEDQTGETGEDAVDAVDGAGRVTVVLDRDGIVSAVLPAVEGAGEGGVGSVGRSAARRRHLHLPAGRSVTRPGLDAPLPDPEAVGGAATTDPDDWSGGLPASGNGSSPVAAGGTGPAGPGPAVPMALEVSLPDAVRLGDTVPLLVELEPGPGGPGSAPLGVHADEVLEILASPSSGFTLASRTAVRTMTVVVDGPTLPVKFTLTADVAGRGVVKVFAFREDTCVASITVSALITAGDVPVVESVPATLVVPAAVSAAADLTLVVLKESYRGGVALRYRLTTGDGGVVSDFGPHALDADPGGYVHARFAEIQQLAAGPGTWGAPERLRLERIGADLYESLVPTALRDVLWDSGRVQSLLVETEEPWIPWELCRMTAERDGRTVSRGYLCELYEMSRWLPGSRRVRELRASRVGVVAPRDSGLPSSPAEVAMLEGLAADGLVVDRVKATYASVIQALESHRYDVLHFVGHGRNTVPTDATQSEFALSGRWRLTPSDLSGETRNLGLAAPVVVMNACQVSQASMALHGIGGWAAAMTRAGAGAFVGTHWDVRDDLALEFATAFYQQLRTSTVASAVREARAVVRDKGDGDPTWLAYTVHAAPDARCEFGSPEP
jgi:hypothetical protein